MLRLQHALSSTVPCRLIPAASWRRGMLRLYDPGRFKFSAKHETLDVDSPSCVRIAFDCVRTSYAVRRDGFGAAGKTCRGNQSMARCNSSESARRCRLREPGRCLIEAAEV